MENQNTVQTVQEGEQAEAVPPSGLRREIKTYVLRAGRMTAAQEKAYNELGWKAELGIEEMCKDAYNFVKNVK